MALKLIKETILNQRIVIFFYILNTGVLLLVYGLRYSFANSLYPIILSTVLLIIYLIYRYNKLRKLTLDIDNLKHRNYTVDYNPDVIDNYYIELIESIHDEYHLKIEAMSGRNHRNEQLLSQFFHNMKTSVAVIELATERQNVEVADIRLENDKLKHQLEQSLNVLRLDRFVQDYMPERYSIRALLTEVINEQKSSFIYNQIYPKVSGEDYIIFTDRKWFKYLIEQLVSNAIKYSDSENSIEFILNQNSLTIRDYGIGIKSNELERIFDLFYTGTNGRNNNQSTGIGLSMVKTVGEMLDIEISVESEVNTGTTFILKFLTKM